MSDCNTQLPPGSVIGILGGGQLGMMSAEAATRLGYTTLVWAPPGDNPAARTATDMITADYNDLAALERFLDADVVTVEFENVPVELLEEIEAAGKSVRPSPAILRIAQDRWEEKQFFDRTGIPATKTRPIGLTNAFTIRERDFPFPALLKTRRLGYDGKGQALVHNAQQVEECWQRWGQVPCVLEALVDFECELSVIVARDIWGKTMAYSPIKNEHLEGILRVSRCPAVGVSNAVLAEAMRVAIRTAKALDLIGLLAVEMFVTKDGRVLANEIAPRPHNSGHGTIEGSVTSQFEQHIRAVAGMPLGDPRMTGPWRMHNVIGTDDSGSSLMTDVVTSHMHMYGKLSVREGRKMGHITHFIGA